MSLAPIHPFTDSPVHILVGPEGGSQKMKSLNQNKKGFIVTSLGKRILRAEHCVYLSINISTVLTGRFRIILLVITLYAS